MKVKSIVWKGLSVLLASIMLLSACAAPTPQVVIQTQVVTVKETQVVTVKETAEPQAAGIKPPVAYPAPNKLDVGGAEVKRLPIDQIVTYKALPAYKEPDWVAKLVADGKLPPVKDRLPKEPQVYLTSGMKDGIGVYGDLWRGFSACPTAGYNDLAGTTMGWFGIESYTSRYGALVKTGPLYRADQDIIPMPEIAKSWDW
ncbi:MAG: ABC transporter substrate-binding protein, partial [Chloroflexi bacterium]